MPKNPCRKCRGKGYVDNLIDAVYDWLEGAPGCPSDTCPRCKGSGDEPDPKSFEAKHWH